MKVVTIRFESDTFLGLTCELEGDGAHAVITAADAGHAAADLKAALHAALDNGIGECFWDVASGQYRWVFRREGVKLTIAVMWSRGAVTGWEHAFWAQADAVDFAARAMDGLHRLP